MKKINNKFRSNVSNGNNSSSNTIYSLNYKFDSNSIAGKISGTALDLIKRYNDFAKEAQSNNDYVSAEIFRQYAEHYRKIVTEINERKSQLRQAAQQTEENTPAAEEEQAETAPAAQPQTSEADAEAKAVENSPEEEVKAEAPVVSRKEPRKSFKIIEISHAKVDEAVAGGTETVDPAPKRTCRRRKTPAVLS